MKYVVFLGDGMADFAVKELGNKTPLEVAKKPNIDFLASKGTMGMIKTVPDGMKPGSDVANLGAMGFDPQEYYTGRSPLEAVSVGIDLDDSDITFRVNLVTLSDDENYEDKTMIDYSSDEITTEEAAELINDIAKQLDTDIYKFYPGFSYRHVLVWNGGHTDFQLTPPHDITGKKVAEYLPKGKDSHVLLDFMKKSCEILKDHPVNKKRIERGLRPASSIWVWGEGKKAVLPEFEKMRGVKGAVVSAVDLIKGIGISAKMTCAEVEGATGNIHTNFEGKAEAAINLLKDHDFVYIHVEAPDECGHRGEVENKVKSIEIIDQKIVGPVLNYLNSLNEDYKALVMPDHPTPLELMTHVADPVPFIVFQKSKQMDENTKVYTEENCKKSGIYYENGYKLMDDFID
ncbi:MAG: cofactor-independent phosphoglycerate mutase [Clostridia bacterium]|nr:cofactor-independent phosphoglycerate mutase [Clostridia bacterium]